jgi:methyl-accepting chemotaxis protein
MKTTTMDIDDILNGQLTQTQQVMPLRSFVVSIINADNQKELEEINKKLQELRKEDTQKPGEGQTIEESIKVLLSQKSNQLSTLSDLAELRKSIVAALDEVINLAINVVDNTEFDSTIKMDDALTEIRDNIGKMAVSSSINEQIDKISNTAETAIATIKAALSLRSLCNELNALVKETLASTDIAYIDYAKIEVGTLLGNTNNEIDMLPRDEKIKKISILLENLGGLIDGMVEVKKQVLFAGEELNKTSAMIWEQIRKVDNTVLDASQEVKSNAGKALEISTDLVNRWQSVELVLVIGSLILAILIGAFFSGLITRTINKAVIMLKDIAEGEGDLTERLEVGSEDETGELAKWFNVFIEKLQGIIKDISVNAETLNTSSTDLSSLSGQMVSSAEEMKSQSESVASATEEMSVNINVIASATEEMSENFQSVSSTAEQVSQNMNSVATSIEEMSVSINDVSVSANEGSDIAGKAMEMSGSATNTMNTLGKAAKEIGEVTDLIKRIAEQTNLLALNATIEAASAGDAGKGFAVVANEIKELANQSGQAAEDIAKRIDGVQLSTEEAAKVIVVIADIIGRINESSLVITKSVEQQTITANEISSGIQQANTGTNNIAHSIAEVAKGSNDMAKSAAEAAKGVNEVLTNIQGVSQAAGDSNAGAQQVDTSAGELAKMAAQIREMVGKFKVEAASASDEHPI